MHETPSIVQAIEQAINARIAAMAPAMAEQIYQGLAKGGHTELRVPKLPTPSPVEQAMPEIERMLAAGKSGGQISMRTGLSKRVVYKAIARLRESGAQGTPPG